MILQNPKLICLQTFKSCFIPASVLKVAFSGEFIIQNIAIPVTAYILLVFQQNLTVKIYIIFVC